MLTDILRDVHRQFADNDDGKVADYIPALADANPDHFGLAIVTTAGEIHAVGDADVLFTIQSASKPFTFGLAFEEFEEETYTRVGTEPSGEAFNSIALDADGKPFNPMINAGAISMCGLLHERHGDDAFDVILREYGRFAGAELGFDGDVYRSEIGTAHRNLALCHLMRHGDVVTGDVEAVVDLYTRQCAITVSATQLATMAATIANIGTNPVTDDQILSPLTVRHILSVMFTCGMYDYAGRWAVDVGLPAKSGVSGDVMAVVNRQIGIGLFSPPLDERGNSVRAIQSCVQLTEEFGLHAFEFSNRGSSLLSVYL